MTNVPPSGSPPPPPDRSGRDTPPHPEVHRAGGLDRRTGSDRRRVWRPSHGWRSRDVLRAAGLVIGLYLLLRLLWFANPLVLTGFLGVLFGLAVTAGVDYLQRWRIPRGIGAFLIVFGFIGLMVAFFAWSGPTLAEQSRELRERLPQALDRAEEWLVENQGGLLGSLIAGGQETTPAVPTTTDTVVVVQPAAPVTAPTPPAPADTAAPADTTPVADTVLAADTLLPGDTAAAPLDTAAPPVQAPVAPPVLPPLVGDTVDPQPAPTATEAAATSATLRNRILGQLSGATRYLFPFLSSTLAVVAGILLIIFLAIYVAVEPKTYHDGLMHLFPHDRRERMGEVLTAIATVLRRWLVTQLIAMVVIGTVTTVVLLLLDVRAAFPLGVLAGLLEFIPTIGPILSAVPAIAMGFVDSPEKALYVALAYWGIQFVENQLLIPILMREGVDIPPALTIGAQALMALVFGFLGLVVAVPLLAATMVAVRMLYVEDVMGDELETLEATEET